jgi:hypothetical protein
MPPGNNSVHRTRQSGSLYIDIDTTHPVHQRGNRLFRGDRRMGGSKDRTTETEAKGGISSLDPCVPRVGRGRESYQSLGAVWLECHGININKQASWQRRG